MKTIIHLNPYGRVDPFCGYEDKNGCVNLDHLTDNLAKVTCARCKKAWKAKSAEETCPCPEHQGKWSLRKSGCSMPHGADQCITSPVRCKLHGCTDIECACE